MLNSLASSDKHRLLPVAAAQTESAGFVVIAYDPDISDMRLHFGAVKTGTVVAEYPFSGPPGTEMDVYPHFTFGVGFRQGEQLTILPSHPVHVRLYNFSGICGVTSSGEPFRLCAGSFETTS
jgi:hypothetical protein